MKLELHRWVKPFNITQAWGIRNPSYEQFGFTRHNGVDTLEGADRRIHCPQKAEVLFVGHNDGAGNYVQLRTTDMWEADGTECYVWMMFMHLEKATCKVGDILDIGGEIGVSDHTGFSTGPHIHCTFRRLTKYGTQLDTDPATNFTFDPMPYTTTVSAIDYYKWLGLNKQLILLLQRLVGLLQVKNTHI